MTLFEIYITVIFGAASTIIGTLLWLNLSAQRETLKEHSVKLHKHAGDIQKNTLDIDHAKELAKRSEQEFKTLLEANNDKFDQLIGVVRESMNR